jgi:outer membrane lipoprotein-sorting protein
MVMNNIKRWIPAALAPAMIALGVVAIPMQANAIDLPDVTPQELMLLMESNMETNAGLEFSGTVVKTTDLGLPALNFSSMMNEDMVAEMEEKMPPEMADFVPQIIESNTLTQALELIAGTHKMRVYVGGEDQLRVQILDPMSQRDLILNGTELWIYDAKSATAMNTQLDYEVDQAAQSELEGKLAELEAEVNDYAASIALDISSPAAVADYIMAQVTETTTVTVGTDKMVAGRGAYELIIEPKAQESLVAKAVISIDAENGMPLKAEVFSKEQAAAAVSVGFESISFAPVADSLFDFTPPAGTTVEDLVIPELPEMGQPVTEADLNDLKAQLEAEYANSPQPKVIGEDWTSVVYLPAMPQDVPMELMGTELFGDMFETVPGGKVFSTPLVNVLILDSGEVYAGAVTVDYLVSVSQN